MSDYKSYRSVFRKNLFQDQVALVTGGGTGLGRCIAHELASLGAKVILAARRTDVLQETCDEIKKFGGQAYHYSLNIRNADNVQTVLETIIKDHGRLDMLVNNAGGQFLAPAEKISLGGMKTVMELNVLGTWAVTLAAFKVWMKEHGGRIVNITADFRNGFPLMMHTGAARAAVDNLTKTLCQEWAGYGIRINAVAPGTIISSGMKNYPDPVQKIVSEKFHSSNPSGRLGSESETSGVVVWLLSPGASYVNGASIPVDGGSSLSKAGMIPYPKTSRIPMYQGYPNDDLETRDIPPVFQNLLKEKYIKAKI